MLRDIFFKDQQVCFELIDMPLLEKTKQVPARQIIHEQMRGDLDKITQVVTALANVELVTTDLAELEPPAAAPKVNSLLVSLCALLLHHCNASLCVRIFV